MLGRERCPYLFGDCDYLLDLDYLPVSDEQQKQFDIKVLP